MGSRRGLIERDLGRLWLAVASDTPSTSLCAPKSALCPSVSMPYLDAMEPGAECFRFPPPRYGSRLGPTEAAAEMQRQAEDYERRVDRERREELNAEWYIHVYIPHEARKRAR